MNDIQYYEEVDDLDAADALIDELMSDYPEDEGWSHDYTLDIRYDKVCIHFEAWRD
jgi:hypothetical protein